MQKFPIDSYSNENIISPFFRPPPDAANPQSGTRVRPHANFGVNRPAGCREIIIIILFRMKQHNYNNTSKQ